MTFTGKLVYMVHNFILLGLNHFGLRADMEGWRFEQSVPYFRVRLSGERVKIISWDWLFLLPGYDSWLWHFMVILYAWFTISSCYGLFRLPLELIGSENNFSTLYHSCGFACHQRVLKTFSGPGYFHSEDWVVWLWHLLVNLYIWFTISSWYCSVPLALRLIRRDSSLSILCHRCGFACQQRFLTKFTDLAIYPLMMRWSDYDVFWWICIYSSYYGSVPFTLGLIGRQSGVIVARFLFTKGW